LADICASRESFRTAFADFRVGPRRALRRPEVARLLGDAGIVRHRARSKRHRQRIARGAMAREGSPAGSVDRAPSRAPAMSDLIRSVALSRSQARGFRFVDDVYASMQAAGIVNDHTVGCFVRGAVSASAARQVRYSGGLSRQVSEARASPSDRTRRGRPSRAPRAAVGPEKMATGGRFVAHAGRASEEVDDGPDRLWGASRPLPGHHEHGHVDAGEVDRALAGIGRIVR